ncbi:MAG: hypothetical protein V2A54_03350 [Bacteroidota bacterium]
MKKITLFILGFLFAFSVSANTVVTGEASSETMSAGEMYFKISPDPTQSGVFNLEFANPENEQMYVTIFNSEGDAVYTNNFSSSVKESVDLFWKGEGVFYVLVETESVCRVGRVVVYR